VTALRVKNINPQRGFSLLELVCTLSVLAILVMGTIPIAQNAVTRQKEMRLREALREMRAAIDEFKRDTLGACAQGGSGQTSTVNQTQAGGGAVPTDPRSRVVIDDCKIFESDNIDRYPPTLDILVSGVRIKPRAPDLRGGSGLDDNSPQATELNQDKEVKKIYLREIPVDPLTGEKDWKFRSSYQGADADNWDEINVIDVRSNAKGEALNGEKYSDF
jgi:general secretion pathway protein G